MKIRENLSWARDPGGGRGKYILMKKKNEKIRGGRRPKTVLRTTIPALIRQIGKELRGRDCREKSLIEEKN